MPTEKYPPGTAIRVKWLDSQAFKGWFHDSDTPFEIGQVVSIGYVVVMDDDKVVITHSLDTKGDALDPLAVPAQAIVKVELIGEEWNS